MATVPTVGKHHRLFEQEESGRCGQRGTRFFGHARTNAGLRGRTRLPMCSLPNGRVPGMSEQAILMQGPAAGRVVEVELNGNGWPPDHLVVESVSQERVAEWLRPLAPDPEIYLRTFWSWNVNGEPAKDDEGRWCFMWRDPRNPNRFS